MVCVKELLTFQNLMYIIVLEVHCFRTKTASQESSQTNIKNHFYKMKRDIGMAGYEKLVKQEFYTPSLYLCFVEQDAAEQSSFM